jgi:hypothetical protein
VPKKTGVDASTVVQEDLFGFDSEVEPLLEVLTKKTLDQALLEVEHEEELTSIARALVRPLEEALAQRNRKDVSQGSARYISWMLELLGSY